MITTTISGNVALPEFKAVGDTSLLEFSVASTEKAGEKEYTTWLSCKIWGKRAEALEKYILKGTALILSGSLREESWEKDGEKRSKLVLNVDKLDFQRGGKSDKPAKEADDFEDDEDFPF